MDTHYGILGVKKTATTNDIRSAFRRISRTHHPDKVSAEKRAEATRRFCVVKEAYETLIDPAKRQLYDSQFHGAPGGGGFAPRPRQTSSSTMFEQMFRQQRPRPKQQWQQPNASATGPPPPTSSRGSIAINCTLEELFHGKRCTHVAPNGVRLVINVQPGTHDGAVIAMPQMGMCARIVQMPHKTFRREGDDLHVTVRLALRNALLQGTRYRVPLIEGGYATTALQHIAAPGSRIVIPRRGMRCPPKVYVPNQGQKDTPTSKVLSSRGNLVVHFSVVFPKSLTPAQKAAVRQMLPETKEGEDDSVGTPTKQ